MTIVRDVILCDHLNRGIISRNIQTFSFNVYPQFHPPDHPILFKNKATNVIPSAQRPSIHVFAHLLQNHLSRLRRLLHFEAFQLPIWPIYAFIPSVNCFYISCTSNIHSFSILFLPVFRSIVLPESDISQEVLIVLAVHKGKLFRVFRKFLLLWG